MTTAILAQEKKVEQVTPSALDLDIQQLLEESGLGSGIDGLLGLGEKLQRDPKSKKLTPDEMDLALAEIKKDIQDPDFLSFERGQRAGIDFGFEGLGDDIIPTLSPYGDCIVPVNFWYNNQRRTLLLVFKINHSKKNSYQLPEGDNLYQLEYNKESFHYQLVKRKGGFSMQYQQ